MEVGEVFAGVYLGPLQLGSDGLSVELSEHEYGVRCEVSGGGGDHLRRGGAVDETLGFQRRGPQNAATPKTLSVIRGGDVEDTFLLRRHRDDGSGTVRRLEPVPPALGPPDRGCRRRG